MKTKEKRFLNIIGLLIVILPMELFWRLTNPTDWEFYSLLFETFLTIPLGYAMYLFSIEREKWKIRLFVLTLILVSWIFVFCRFFVPGFEAAILNVVGYIFCFKVSKAVALLIFIIDNRKYMFSQPIITVFSILFIIMILLLWYKEYGYLTI